MVSILVLQKLLISYFIPLQQPDDDDSEILNQEEEFSLPQSFFVKEEPWELPKWADWDKNDSW